MKNIIFLFIIFSIKLHSQQWYQFKLTDSLDTNFKGYPSYILIDTTRIKDCSNVIVEHNFIRIKPQGNRFYLKAAPFNYELRIELNEQEKINFDNQSKPITHFVSSKDFNIIHEKNFFRNYTNSDTVEIGKLYESFILIDSTMISDVSSISIITTNNRQLKRTGNKFYFSVYQASLGPKEYNLIIIKNNKDGTSDSTKTAIYTYGINPKNKVELDYILFPDISPVFTGNEYKSFDDYFIAKSKENKLLLSGKVFLCYTVMKDGKTRFEWAKGKITSEQTETIKRITTSYKNWIPGKHKDDIVNVNITAVYNFQP